MKYFTELKLSGYKSIQDVTVKLNPGINIFIGPNGSGKSNLLRFIKFLEDEIPEIESNYSITAKWFSNDFSIDKSLSKDIIPFNEDQLSSRSLTKNSHIDFFQEEYNLKFLIDGKLVIDEKIKNKYELYNKLSEYSFESINEIGYVQFPNNDVQKFLTYPANVSISSEEISPLLRQDNNWPFQRMFGYALLDTHLRDKKPSLKMFEKHFERYSDQYKDLLRRYSPVKNMELSKNLDSSFKDNRLIIENIQLRFELENGWYSWEELSDGTKRIISLIYYVSDSKEVILIDEPELGIHPHQLSLLMQFLKEEAFDKQIILTTHSPDVLDILSPKDFDSINIVSNHKGKTKVKKLTTKQKQKAQDYMDETGSVGDYWKYSDLEV